MTEIGFKDFILKLVSLMSADKPSHLINIEFFQLCIEIQVEAFVFELNEYLENNKIGICDIYGVNENFIGGIFYIKLNDNDKTTDVINKLKDLSQSYSFLEIATINTKYKEGDFYKTKSILIGNHEDNSFEDYPDLPITENDISQQINKKGGCMFSMSILLTLIILLISSI